MKSLYHISNQYLALMEAIEANEGEITESLGELLDSNECDREALINALCTEIANASRDTAIVKEEMERLGGRIAANEAKQDRLKIQIIKVLKFFGMRSATKGSTGFGFKTALFSGFTKEVESMTFDDARLEEFAVVTKAMLLKIQGDSFSVNPEEVTVNKESKFVTYKLTDKINRDLAVRLVEEDGFSTEALVPVIDKTAAKAYIKSIANIDESEVEIDPIASLAIYNTKESLIVK